MKKGYIVATAVFLAAVLVVSVGALWLFFGRLPIPEPEKGNTKNEAITIYDAQGNVLITTNTGVDIYDTEYWAYLEIVLAEMTQIIQQQEQCDTAQARNKLFTQAYQIHTAFDKTAFEALQKVESRWGKNLNTAGAITDLNGNLLAVRCTDTKDKQVNYALERRSPYSSFKALSVYTPAVEQGVANWSTMYVDSPYKQIKDDAGKLEDWPANATGIFSQKKMTVYDALRFSTNTIAVKCLKDVGVTRSVEFLQERLGIPLTQEEYVIEKYGEEEVIGNIALGYLEVGITPVEMAGYYQMFANGGSYIPPKTVQTVNLKDSSVWYTRKEEPKQVISSATADTMNKLLQGVVAAGGTGAMAQCSGVDVAGKTGTGDNYADNWFVGVTPGYSLALWHGQHDTNQAEEMFAAVIENLYSKLPNANRKFVTHHNLYQIAYCVHSGKAFSSECTLIDVGYFASKDTLPVCETCKKGEVVK
ncbi:MAG: hypothetical protein E7421_03345 [Ruminococcaceae bacterium]|nr:hypothetical protein [Oscillospiraceae bacterium]